MNKRVFQIGNDKLYAILIGKSTDMTGNQTTVAVIQYANYISGQMSKTMQYQKKNWLINFSTILDHGKLELKVNGSVISQCIEHGWSSDRS